MESSERRLDEIFQISSLNIVVQARRPQQLTNYEQICEKTGSAANKLLKFICQWRGRSWFQIYLRPAQSRSFDKIALRNFLFSRLSLCFANSRESPKIIACATLDRFASPRAGELEEEAENRNHWTGQQKMKDLRKANTVQCSLQQNNIKKSHNSHVSCATQLIAPSLSLSFRFLAFSFCFRVFSWENYDFLRQVPTIFGLRMPKKGGKARTAEKSFLSGHNRNQKREIELSRGPISGI